MADFEFSMDMNKIFPKGIQDEDLALKMIDAGQDVMLKAIKAGASRHKVTGHMANSLVKTKPMINKNGDAVGRIKFSGSDGVSKSKGGQRFDRTNWIKAFRIEFGTSKQNAQPFVRPAIQSSENGVRSAMEKAFNQKAN
ncbi:MAG: hypothetical protein RUMPE_01351 [Eubacteriales bacterium SKADARSKE-1]|nr:hypothetical protein [Eubacteriales bacterium SKADARSKE-1]